MGRLFAQSMPAALTSDFSRRKNYYSIEYPAFFQAANPPRRGVTFLKPFASKYCAARALDSSAGQVQ